jgi:ABC-type glycerol-3-phosphate transport system substrate-binding protein
MILHGSPRQTRREFLLTVAAGGLASLAVACQPTPGATAASPTPAPAAAQAAPAEVAGATVARFELWHIFNGALGDALSGLLTEFQAQQPSIGVDATYVPYDAMLQTLLSAISAGTPPAAAVLEMTLMARLAAENALAPVESLLTATGAATLKDSLVPSIRDANSVGGALCTVPLGYNSNQLYYNPDLLQRASLDPEHDLPASWDALVEVAPRLTVNRTADQQADVWGYGFPARAPWILEVRFWQSGAELFDPAGKQAVFNSAEGRATFDNYRRMQASGGALMVSADTALNQLADLFSAGKLAFFEQSSTAFAGIAEKAPFQSGVGRFRPWAAACTAWVATTSASSARPPRRSVRLPSNSSSGGPRQKLLPGGPRRPTTYPA